VIVQGSAISPNLFEGKPIFPRILSEIFRAESEEIIEVPAIVASLIISPERKYENIDGIKRNL